MSLSCFVVANYVIDVITLENNVIELLALGRNVIKLFCLEQMSLNRLQ